MMRVVSLLPAATEIVTALGGQGSLVGISHQCDWPPAIRGLPRVTSTPIDIGAGSGAIDRTVRDLREQGQAVIAVDGRRLRQLAPDLIITQHLCEVCAVADGQVHRIADLMDPSPSVLALEANDLAGVFEDIQRVGDALELAPEAVELAAGLRYRLERLRWTAPSPPPNVLCIEWLDPFYLAGHWVPDLVAAAGGSDIGARPGQPSRRLDREELQALRPDVVVVMLCGFGLERAAQELERSPLPSLGAPVWLLDGSAYTSRAGPRVVDGATLLQAAFRGDRSGSSPALRRVPATDDRARG